MIRTGLLGLGKMGISHLAIMNAHPDLEVAAICDTSEFVLDVLKRYGGFQTYTDFRELLKKESLDAVFVATPSKYHGTMVRASLEAGAHVFCEKPFCLDTAEGQQLAELAEVKRRVNQVGYHYRFVGVFHELKRLLDIKILGKLSHIRIEAHGPVVLRSAKPTWRTSKSEGGGCLHDYASHAIDLANYLVGPPQAVAGTVMSRMFSRDVEDEVYATLSYNNGMTGQVSVNWSDDSQRKMSTKVTLWGTNGKAAADRQELQLYLRNTEGLPADMNVGWNVRYTTDLVQPVWYYLRGEEYSAQIDHFVRAIKDGRVDTRSTFRTALDTDLVANAMVRDAGKNREDIV